MSVICGVLLMEKKKIILKSLPLLGAGIIMAIFVLAYLFGEVDINKDGKKDLKIYWNFFYLVGETDFDKDGTFDLREYQTYGGKVVKVQPLNDKFREVEVRIIYEDGTKCILKENVICKNTKSRVISKEYILHNQLLFAVSL